MLCAPACCEVGVSVGVCNCGVGGLCLLLAAAVSRRVFMMSCVVLVVRCRQSIRGSAAIRHGGRKSRLPHAALAGKRSGILTVPPPRRGGGAYSSVLDATRSPTEVDRFGQVAASSADVGRRENRPASDASPEFAEAAFRINDRPTQCSLDQDEIRDKSRHESSCQRRWFCAWMD